MVGAAVAGGLALGVRSPSINYFSARSRLKTPTKVTQLSGLLRGICEGVFLIHSICHGSQEIPGKREAGGLGAEPQPGESLRVPVPALPSQALCQVP